MDQETRTITIPRELAITVYISGIRSKEIAETLFTALTTGLDGEPGMVDITLLERDALKWEELLKDNSLQVPMETGHRLSEAFVMGASLPAPEDLRWKLVAG